MGNKEQASLIKRILSKKVKQNTDDRELQNKTGSNVAGKHLTEKVTSVLN